MISLGAAMALSAVAILWFGRGGTYWQDDLAWFAFTPDLSPLDALEPHYGHLILVPRLLYKAVLETSGGSDYLSFRLIQVFVVAFSAGLFFAYARRRVGDLAALFPSVLLLFLGADWQNTVIPIGITVVGGVAFGLGALLALDRDDRRGDRLACALLCLGAATFSNAIPFVAAVAVSVLLRPDRWARVWIFALPLAFYATWYLTAAKAGVGPDDQTSLSNLLIAPIWAFESLSTVMASLSGLSYDFRGGFGQVDLDVGRPIAVLALVGLGWHIQRRGISTALLVVLTVPMTYWILGSLASGIQGRTPEGSRYIYAGTLAVLLVVVEVLRLHRPSRRVLAGIAALGLAALAMNVALMRDGSRFYRQHSDSMQAQLLALDLARSSVSPDFDPTPARSLLRSPWEALRRTGAEPTAAYLQAASRYGSPGFTVAELVRQSDVLRADTDAVLASAYALTVTSTSPPAAKACASSTNEGEIELPPGGADLRVRGAAGSELSVRRFATDQAFQIGTMPSGWAELAIPDDDADQPWRASVSAGTLEVCPLSPRWGESNQWLPP